MNSQRCFALVRDLLCRDAPHPAEEVLLGLDDASEFLAFLERHQLSAALGAHLRDRDLRDQLPEGVRGGIAQQALAEWSRSAALATPMKALHLRFRERGIEHVFLKGPLFAERCCGGVERRRSTDIDLLVRSADLARAEAALEDEGFACLAKGLPGVAITRRVTHHSEFAREPTVAELHWSLARHCGLRISEEDLWEGTSEVDFSGVSFPVPSLETTLLALILGLATDVGLGGARLRSLFDLRNAVLAFPNGFEWSRFFARCEVRRCEGLALAMLELCFATLGCDDAKLEACKAALKRRKFQSLLCEPGVIEEALLQEVIDLFEAEPPAWANKQRVFRCLEPPLAVCWAWWLGSLPWRIAAHPSV